MTPGKYGCVTFRGLFGRRSRFPFCAGVIDRDIELAEAGWGSGNRIANVLLAAYVSP